MEFDWRHCDIQYPVALVLTLDFTSAFDAASFKLCLNLQSTSLEVNAATCFSPLWPSTGNLMKKTCHTVLILVLYDAVNRNKISIRHSPFFIFIVTHYMFRPYGPSSGEIYNYIFEGLFLIQRIRCTYAI
jgi:hypothetical protein